MRFAELAQLYSRKGVQPHRSWMVSVRTDDQLVLLVLRLPAAGLPRSLQHDDRSGPLGAPAEGEVRLGLLRKGRLVLFTSL